MTYFPEITLNKEKFYLFRSASLQLGKVKSGIITTMPKKKKVLCRLKEQNQNNYLDLFSSNDAGFKLIKDLGAEGASGTVAWQLGYRPEGKLEFSSGQNRDLQRWRKQGGRSGMLGKPRPGQNSPTATKSDK